MKLWRSRKLRIAAFVVAAADVLAVAIWWPLAEAEAHARAPRVRADAAIVFFGDWGEQTRARVDKAVDLLHSGEAGAIILAGGCRLAEPRNGGELMTRMALDRAADPSRLLRDQCSYDTRSNLVGAAAVAEREQFASFILVSDALHLQRIRGLAYGMPLFSGAAEEVGEASSPGWAWLRAHHEVAAYLFDAMPEGLRDEIVRSLRGQRGQLRDQSA